MKRIFLTSGLVVCMACPAFATIDLDTDGNVTGYENECVQPVLGVYEADSEHPVQLEAKWNANVGAITLVSSIYPSNNHSATAKYTGDNNDGLTVAAPTPIYSAYENGIYTSAANAAALTSPITELTTDPSKTGYIFNGFYTADGNTQVIDNTGAFTSVADEQITAASGGTATWYAHWTPKTYSVTYAPGAHGTGGTTTNNALTYDADYTVLGMGANASTVVANAGYTFAGWTETIGSTDTGNTRAAGYQYQPWQSDAALTLTATYTANPYQITYAGGTAGSRPVTATAMSATNVNYDETNITLATNTYAIDGYHFTGWSGDHDASDGSATTTPYAAGATIAQYKVVGNLGLTAQWAANATTVSYSCVMDNTVDGNSQSVYSGTAPTTNTSATYDASFAFAANTNCARAGWTFDGWTCKSGNTDLTMAAVYGTTGEHANDTVLPANSAATWLYTGADQGSISCVAHYTANTINLNWYADSIANGATEPMDVDSASDSCIYDGSVTVPAAPTKNGYTFQGWTVRSTTPANN